MIQRKLYKINIKIMKTENLNIILTLTKWMVMMVLYHEERYKEIELVT